MDLSENLSQSTEVTTITTVPIEQLPAVLGLNFADIEKKAQVALERIKSFAVTNQDEADFVSSELARAKNGIAKLEAARLSQVQPLTDYSKAVNALFAPSKTIWGQVKDAAEAVVVQWDKKQRERVAAERAEAERVAAEERKRLAAEAEAKQAEAAKIAQEAHAAQDTPTGDVLNQQAQQVAAEAQSAAVQAVTTVAEYVPLPQTQGSSIGQNWTFEIQDCALAIEGIYANPLLRDCLMIDPVKYRAKVKALKLSAAVPGIYVYDKGTVRSTKAK
jgi:hypothetical protein